MKMHPTADEIRGELKRKNPRTNFFEVEDKRSSKSRTYRIGMFHDKLTTEEVLSIVNEHYDVFDVTHDEHKIDFSVKDFDGRRNDMEMFEILCNQDYSTLETTDESIGVFMKQLITDFGKDVGDQGVETKHALGELVNIYANKYSNIWSLLWGETWPEGVTEDKIKQMRTMLVQTEMQSEGNLFRVYYAKLVLPQIREIYPHWNL